MDEKKTNNWQDLSADEQKALLNWKTSIESDDVALSTLSAYESEDFLGGVVVSGHAPEIFDEQFNSGVLIGSQTTVKETYVTVGGFVVSGSLTEFHRSEFRSFSCGLVFDGETTNSVFHPKATCGIVDTVNFCGCVEPEDTTGGFVFGSASWWAANRVGDGLQRWHPLAEHGGVDIAHGQDAEGFGELDLIDGIICETAEQFRANRYYELAFPKYWDGLTITFWFRYVENIFEQTLFSYDPSLRLGVTWLGEPVIQVRWFDETEQEVFCDPIEKDKWLHFALRFNPSEELGLFIDGQKVCGIDNPKDFFDVADAGSFIGNLQNGSFINGDVQDFRIYHGARSWEWIKAERDSFCEQWIETVELF